MWWNNYVGIPYENEGYDRSGLNCYGLVRLIQKEVFRKDLPKHNDNLFDVDWYRPLGVAIPLGSVSSGDIIHMFIIQDGKRIDTHVGVVTEPGSLIHTTRNTGSTIVRYDRKPWKNFVIGAYQIV